MSRRKPIANRVSPFLLGENNQRPSVGFPLGEAWFATLSLLIFATYVAAARPGPPWPAVEELPERCRAAKAEFRPLTPADLRAVKEELVEAAARLDRRLKAAGKNGANWRRYLRWDRLQRELSARGLPDADVLEAIRQRYAAEHEGLELVWFADVRDALRQYRNVARNVGNPDLEPAYRRLLDFLAEHLETYAAQPTAEEALIIGRAVQELEAVRQAPELVAAIRHGLSRPNLSLHVSAELVAAGIAGPVDETAPVRDVILRTDIYGTGHTTGRVTLELWPQTTRGVIDTVFRGLTRTRNTGYHGRITIYSRGTTGVGARKRIWVDESGLSALPAVSKAATRSTITGIASARGRRLIQRLAWRRAAKQKRQAEWIASRHAERRVNRRIDTQVAELLARANEAFVGNFRRPLLERRLFPRELRFSTSGEALRVVTLQSDASQLGAPGPPEVTLPACDLGLQMHESMVNNMAASALAGRTVDDEELRAAVVELFGKLPEALKPEEDAQPWAIAFDGLQPISVSFAEDRVRLTIRGRRYYRAEKSHPAMNITAVYNITRDEQGYRATRQGELQIFPPGFVPDRGGKLSARQVAIRRLLERRLAKVFEEQVRFEGFVPPGKWSKAGRLRPAQLVCRKGWLTVAWKAEPADRAAVAAR